LVRALAAVAETCGRLHAAGVIHRDLNPANIVLDPETGQTQIIDFELASWVPRQHLEAVPVTRLEGTLPYIAPEQTGRTGRAIDHRADLYALGASLFHALTGRPPFTSVDRLSLVHAHLAESPVNPCTLDPTIPRMLGAITLKLLEKEPADRYQSGFGVARDLHRCLAAADSNETFVLATEDAPPWLRFGKALFGRAEETSILGATLDRAAAGRAELVCVAGYSGVGKSSLVMQIQGAVGRALGRFVGAKYDQYTNVPFAAWTQALRRMVRDVLAEADAVLADVRTRALHALEGLGQVVIDLVPEAELLLGAQPAVAELPAGEAQNRFQQVMVRFLRVFASEEHPLVVFLDDLQWADRPSLLLLERLLADPESANFLVVGAYRDNEVPEGHPLLSSVAKLEELGAPVTTLKLSPLGREATAELVASAVNQSVDETAELADLVFEKTGGNPFFAERFMMTLATEGALKHEDGRWSWDPTEIESMGFTDNVADLMARGIGRLEDRTTEALRVAAVIGNRFELGVLAGVLDRPPSEVADALWPALKASVVAPHEGAYRYASLSEDETHVAYRFAHDRVQEAAYALTPVDDRPALHVAVGRALRAVAGDDESSRFAVVTHLNQGRALLDEAGARDLLELNVEAGQHAIAGAAYPAAQGFFAVADELLGDGAWTADYAARFAVTMGRGQAAWMCGDFDAARVHYDGVQLQCYDVTTLGWIHAASLSSGSWPSA